MNNLRGMELPLPWRGFWICGRMKCQVRLSVKFAISGIYLPELWERLSTTPLEHGRPDTA
jgi:hypothetical protein